MLLCYGAAHAGESDALLYASGCTSCHGVEGRAVGAIPRLAGLKAEVFAARMQAFKAGDPAATVMSRIASGYTDAQVAMLANYFSGLRP